MYNTFEIIVPVYNSELWIENNINSCLNQNYPKQFFNIHVSDANSTDGTIQKIKNITSNNFKLYEHSRRLFPLENTKFLVNNCKANSICVLVDGDDWLSDTNVLQRLNQEYNDNNLWMTCGAYAHYPGFVPAPKMVPYTEEEIKNKLYKFTNKWPSHLRTFKKELFLKIKEEDFKNNDGEYYHVSGDVLYTYAMLEMAGEKFKYLSYINYIYNKTNPISDDKLIPEEQVKIAEEIKKKINYSKLEIL